MRQCLFMTFVLLSAAWATLQAQEIAPISKTYLVVTKAYPLPDGGQKLFPDIDFKLGLNKKPPFKLGIQFENHGYGSPKVRFAIKDLTTKKMVLLDQAHNSNFISTTLEAVTKTIVWSSPIDSNKDLFSLRVWNEKGDEFDSASILVSEQ